MREGRSGRNHLVALEQSLVLGVSSLSFSLRQFGDMRFPFTFLDTHSSAPLPLSHGSPLSLFFNPLAHPSSKISLEGQS